MRRPLSLPTLLLLFALTVPAAAAARVTVPDGVRLGTYARGIPQPTNLAWDPQGRLWVSSGGNFTQGADGVWVVPRPGARPRQVVRRLFSALGVAWYRGELFVSHVVPYDTDGAHTGRVTAFGGWDGKRFTRRRTVVAGLPTGLHRVDSLAVGPDERMYLGVGSRFDDRGQPERTGAGIVSFDPAGGDLRVEARGMRNPYGLAFVPGTDMLLASDNGRDDLGLRAPREELNAVDVSAPVHSYGFPSCWAGRGGAACRNRADPVATFAPHSAPGSVAVARRFGPYGLSAFVALFGSSFAGNPTGGQIMRVSFPRGAAPGRRGVASVFARGFDLADLLGAAIGPDGALYVTLWRSGRVLRLAYGS